MSILFSDTSYIVDMCYDAIQLKERIYNDAIRSGAKPEEIDRLRKELEKLKDSHGIPYYHTNGFAHQQLLTFDKIDGEFHIRPRYWGLIPAWSKTEEQANEIWNRTINARGETIFEKPSFRDAAKQHRIIIPLDGFYEHFHFAGNTYPHLIKGNDGESLLVGGLQSSWLNKQTGELMETCAIVTTAANKMMAEIHNNPKLKEPRMPLILNQEDCAVWMEGDTNEVKHLIKPNTDVGLEAYTVRRLRGREYVGNTEEVTEEVRYPELDLLA